VFFRSLQHELEHNTNKKGLQLTLHLREGLQWKSFLLPPFTTIDNASSKKIVTESLTRALSGR
jgi:hypothetical protein